MCQKFKTTSKKRMLSFKTLHNTNLCTPAYSNIIKKYLKSHYHTNYRSRGKLSCE